VKQIKTLNFVDPGKIIRIRGIAYVYFVPLSNYTSDVIHTGML
jgi:hypothetical protein